MGYVKYILIIAVLSFLFIPNYAFIETYNIDGVPADYFSLESPIVKIVSNTSNIVIFYKLNNDSFNRTYNFSSCDMGYCGYVNFLDFINISKDTFLGSIMFIVSNNIENKTIYLDLIRPVLNMSFVLLKNNLTLNISCNDTFSGVSRVNGEILKNGSLLASFNESFKDSLEEGSYTLLVRCYDNAGNVNLFEKSFNVTDFKPPYLEIKSITVQDNNVMRINFTLKDISNISSYKVITADYFITGMKKGNVIDESILVPFSSTFYISTSDLLNNSKSYFINVTLPYLSFPSVFNKNNVSPEGNYDMCTLLKVDGETVLENFSNSFYVPVSKVGNHTLYVSCRKGYVVREFSFPFYYDNNPPSLSNITVEVTKEGVLIKWNPSYDELPVTYILYKNGEVIYKGKDIEYFDKDVVYPNLYEYYLKVSDLAGNFVVTNHVNVTPLDTKAELNLPKKMFNISGLHNVSLKVYGERGSILYVYRVVNGSNVEVDRLFLNSSSIILSLKSFPGVTVYEIRERDPNNNTVSEFVTVYARPIVNDISKESENSKNLVLNSSNHSIGMVRNSTGVNSSSKSLNVQAESLVRLSDFKYFILFILFLLVYVFLRSFRSSRSSVGRDDWVSDILSRRSRTIKTVKKVFKKKRDEKKSEKSNATNKGKTKVLSEYERIKHEELAEKRPKIDLNFLNKKSSSSDIAKKKVKEKKGDREKIISSEQNEVVTKASKVPKKSKCAIFDEGYFDKHRRGWNSRDYVVKEVKDKKSEKKEEDSEKKTENVVSYRSFIVKKTLEDYLVRKKSRFKELLYEKRVDEETKDL